MKAMLRSAVDGDTTYPTLAFCCPGCGGDGLHILPVNTTAHSPSWDWDGNLEAPTVSPSILTVTRWGNKSSGLHVCHSFLRAGIFEFLGDCSHEYANQRVPMPDLPEWFVVASEGGES